MICLTKTDVAVWIVTLMLAVFADLTAAVSPRGSSSTASPRRRRSRR